MLITGSTQSTLIVDELRFRKQNVGLIVKRITFFLGGFFALMETMSQICDVARFFRARQFEAT